MLKFSSQYSGQGLFQLAPRQWKKFVPKSPSHYSQRDIDRAINHQYPHQSKVPLQCATKPTTQCELHRKGIRKQGRSIIDTPATKQHARNSQGINPMTAAQPQRMYRF
ncbi:hypothetical protein UUU_45220 [Klebsiella pneumoniae subsp. pneumoniae DSM 30104 = JCM 1662 = NBRC 14940]|nr:hypothetical protein UUU_45220 [Klebsiella pneumoniae subsp. pneumoniae DSM 30104 = JCM 1662 = NBRC 14940]